MKTVYPVLMKEDSNHEYGVYIPDMDGYTEGKDFYDAIEMARDYIGLMGTEYYDQGKD